MDTFPQGRVNDLEGLLGKGERGYDKLFIIVSEKSFQSSRSLVLNIFSSLNN
jgi:hypothetical protein